MLAGIWQHCIEETKWRHSSHGRSPRGIKLPPEETPDSSSVNCEVLKVLFKFKHDHLSQKIISFGKN
jgi:hypothetical protein